MYVSSEILNCKPKGLDDKSAATNMVGFFLISPQPA